MGLPIGPDTSLVLGELVLSQVDAELEVGLPTDVHGFRFYDDYELFAPSRRAADEALNALTDALAGWELMLNPHKLEIVELPVPMEEEWKSIPRRLRIRTTYPSQERADINALFDEAFRLARVYPREQVIAYAIGRFVSKANREVRRVHPSNWQHFEKLLLQAVLGEPGIVSKVGFLLFWARARGLVLERKTIEDAFNLLAVENAARGRSNEVAWVVWLAIQLDIPIRARAVHAIEKLKDDVVALVALDASDRGIIKRLDTSAWVASMNRAGLESEHWLLAYEARIHGWLPSSDGSDYISADPGFSYLRTKRVKFYDGGATLPSGAIVAKPVKPAPAAGQVAHAPGEVVEAADEEEYG